MRRPPRAWWLLGLAGCAPVEAVVHLDPHALRLSGDGCVVADGRPVGVGEALTLEAWVRVGEIEDAAALVTFDDVAALWIHPDGRAGLSTPPRVGEDGWWGSLGAWDTEPHHVAATWTPSGGGAYIDGQQVAWSNFLELDADATGMRLGCGPGGLHYDGVIDEIRISSTLRYADDFEPEAVAFADDADTIALWHLDTGSGSFALEEGDDYPGLVQGGEWVGGIVEPQR
jgi:hypothetical protein